MMCSQAVENLLLQGARPNIVSGDASPLAIAAAADEAINLELCCKAQADLTRIPP